MEGFAAPWQPAPAPQPEIVALNVELAEELGLDPPALRASATAARIFAGDLVPEGAAPMAQAYAGHQFGGFNPQLGDGRALLLGEVIDRHGNRRDIQLKGSGRTPFSRGGDGKAALGPVLREYIIGEAMFHLGIPTTRALAATTTGETVWREQALPGAVLTRVAASHIRVGTFQFFAARGDHAKVTQLADYVLNRHYPELAGTDDRYLALLIAVRDRQASLVAQWMSVGFIHGVMNTDNMTVSGETIDYGPCAFLDAYDPATVFSSIDHGGRYAFGNQPPIAAWNIARLAETLLGLLDANDEAAVERATEVVRGFPARYEADYLAIMRRKLGLRQPGESDHELVTGLLDALHTDKLDYTNSLRSLADVVEQGPPAAESAFGRWSTAWLRRLDADTQDSGAIAADLRCANPAYIPRNHQVERVLGAAVEHHDFAPMHELVNLLKRPFDDRAGYHDFTLPAPTNASPYRTFCGT